MDKDEKLIKALEVLDAEAENGDGTHKVLHEHIEQLLYDAPEKSLDAIIEKKHTISGAIKQMEQEAKKKIKGGTGCAVLSDREGFEICDKYFGLTVVKAVPETVSIFDL